MLNVKDVQLGTTTRKSFAKINEVMQMPNLIEVQKKSYQWFLDEGLEEVFRDIGSITDYTGNLVLDFIDYTMDEDPKYTIAQCKARDVTYAKPLKVRARLQNKETGEVKENIIFMGDFPLMTDAGTFVINGAERCIVSQLVRSPGVYYHMDHDKTGKELYTNTVIPNRGAWLEYETVSETNRQNILHHFLAEIVIDSKNVPFRKNGTNFVVQSLGAFIIMTKRFFDNYSIITVLRNDFLRFQMLADRPEKARRHRQIIQAISA